MAMVFSRADFEQFKAFVVLSVALKLRIPNAEFESQEALNGAIRTADAPLAQKLAQFLDAYDSWYTFHEKIDSAGRAGSLNSSESEELVRVVGARDATRQQLLSALAAVV